MSETAIRETAMAPWYVRFAEFEGWAIACRDRQLIPWGVVAVLPGRYAVGYQRLPLPTFPEGKHFSAFDAHEVYTGDSRDEAHAAFDELERKLLAGELSKEA